ncbi:polysaccharide deacteylase family 2 protein [uncultured Tateyamaria sp.]|uniref:polysaccharide deacteylase family 2 protein n=1 Tax=Tateyamaria sp. 1078 TaxID=3417464 RepID=UPI0026317891|nr:polysaccharide deacteylase family 2 protein [uncultured Tateyamaria sp.]
MARGFLGGLVVGGVVSVLGAGVASVLSDPPQAPRAGADSPVATAAPTPGDAADATAVTDADLAIDGTAPQVTSPDADDVAAAEAAGSDTAPVPEAGAADDLTDPAAAADSAAVAVDSEAPVLPSPQGALVAAPDTGAELSISTDPAQPPAPDVPDIETAFAPEADDAPETPAAEAPAPDTASVTRPDAPDTAQPPESPASPEAPAAAQPEVDVTEAPETPEADATQDTTEDAGRPTIGRPATSLVDRTDTPAEAEEVPVDVVGPPIEQFAAAFENPEDKPVMSIVLMDTGTDLTGGPVGLAALKSFPYPLTFAVDAQLPDAAERAAEFRSQGFEVMALLDLPAGATGSDTEVNLSAAIAAVPQAVAVMEGVGTGLQESREASDQVAEYVLASGHGLVLQSKGLNTAQKLAVRAGVPAGLIFRDFDSAGQTPTVIRRFLDQAAFRADQEGGVIMVGRLRPDTISALLLWGLQDRAQRVALAPVSHVLKTLAAAEAAQ